MTKAEAVAETGITDASTFRIAELVLAHRRRGSELEYREAHENQKTKRNY